MRQCTTATSHGAAIEAGTAQAPARAVEGTGARERQGAKSEPFRRERLIRFSDCDPAGIVFYPQYFVMFNGLVEDWISDELGIGYTALVIERRIGLPTVHLEADFSAVSRMGDRVALTLAVERLGETSLTLALRCTGVDGDPRMAMRQVLVATSLENHRATAIPADLRAAIMRIHSVAG
jgi:4-hydroxybenzoyl-CoA thioesterase